MITWIQRFFLKHNKWLFGSLLVVIIATFVLTIGPQSFFDGSSGPQQTKLNFYGYDLASPVDQQNIINGAEVSAMLNPELQLRREQLTDYAYIRIAGLGIARQMGIPKPTSDQLTAFIREKAIFQDRETGEFSAETYNQILEMLTSSERFNSKTLARVLEEDYQIKLVRDALTGPFYVLPKEIEADFIALNSVFDFSIARRSIADFETELEISEEDARAYYDENPARYQVPERIQATAAVFKADAFLNQVGEIEAAELQTYFDSNRSRYQPQTEEGEEPIEVTLDDVRDQVEADLKRNNARKIAEKQSEAFSLTIWEQALTSGSPELNDLITEFGGTAQEIPPYSRNAAPSFPNISRQLFNSLWTYTTGKRFFSEIGTNRDGAVVLLINEVIPANIPDFESISEKVISDYREEERVRLFIAEGKLVRDELASALENADSTENAVAEVGLTFEDVESFDGSTIPPVFRQNNLWQQSRYLENGKVSEMIFDGTHGIFVIAESIERPDVDEASPEYQSFVAEQKGINNEGLGWNRLSELSAKALEQLGMN